METHCMTALTAADMHDTLANLRYTSAEELIVRLSPRARSARLGRLKFGSVVQIIRTEKDFTLVAWKDKESEAEIQGWVFARYLKKFN